MPPPPDRCAVAGGAECRRVAAGRGVRVGREAAPGEAARRGGEIEERIGDEPGAARDYLAAFNADSTFREPLEGLVRLLERRRSFRNLGRVIDAFVKSSKKPEEAARALLMKAAYAADVTERSAGGPRRRAARDARLDHGPRVRARVAHARDPRRKAG